MFIRSQGNELTAELSRRSGRPDQLKEETVVPNHFLLVKCGTQPTLFSHERVSYHNSVDFSMFLIILCL